MEIGKELTTQDINMYYLQGNLKGNEIWELVRKNGS